MTEKEYDVVSILEKLLKNYYLTNTAIQTHGLLYIEDDNSIGGKCIYSISVCKL